jgi:lysozyme family protein
LQRVLGVPADGKIGDKTLGAALGMDPTHVIESVNDERLRFLRSLRTWNHFGIGWGRRVQEVRSFSLQLAEAAKRQHPAPPAPTVSPTVGKAIDGDFVDVPRPGIASWFNSLFKGK